MTDTQTYIADLQKVGRGFTSPSVFFYDDPYYLNFDVPFKRSPKKFKQVRSGKVIYMLGYVPINGEVVIVSYALTGKRSTTPAIFNTHWEFSVRVGKSWNLNSDNFFTSLPKAKSAWLNYRRNYLTGREPKIMTSTEYETAYQTSKNKGN